MRERGQGDRAVAELLRALDWRLKIEGVQVVERRSRAYEKPSDRRRRKARESERRLRRARVRRG
jgi:ribosomal protein S21